ncbi:MAG: P-loop NTPase fold protein [Paludibacter sp.]|nr:P-loop NTPase fold protein [Paludibacter sp.]
MENKLAYKFLQNIPIGEDLFEGKSQEKIACVISENIGEGDFQIIGIDGGWGTGKSNLVKIVENKLPKEQYQFFIYDVWGHQGDDQRKAILVELTDFIKEKTLVKDIKKWDVKLTKLLAKEREITTQNYPYLSVGFIFSLLSIIYIPTVNVFKNSISNYFEIEKIFWKLLLVMFPIVIVFGIYIWNIIKFWIEKKGFCKSFKLSAQETFQVYTNKQTQETKTETISENEPTVRDFRDWMKEIDTDLKDNKKKLVIVFDNFDRLPKQHIQNIWSSIHIFFSEDKYNNIKVIIPFDRAHIKNSFSELNGTFKPEESQSVDFANDYINKTFDIVFRISPPIMSAWKDFFKKCWKQTFTNMEDENEYIRVEQIYEAHAIQITPREIIAFINEVVSIKLIHTDIPERYISLFVINKDEILKDPLTAITKAEFLKSLDYLYKDKDDFQKYITALAYQIAPENALEVIYKKQLKDSLTNNDNEKFKDISKTNVFSRIISPVFSEFENFYKPILTLNTLDENANISDRAKQLLWDDIYLRFHLDGRDTIETFQSEKILLTKISAIHRKEFIKKLINIIYNNTNTFDSIKYANVIDELDSICTDNSFDIDVFEFIIEKSIQPKDFLQFVKENEDSFVNYKIITDVDGLDKYLSEFDIASIESLEYLKHLSTDYSFELFEKSLKDKIESNKTDTVNLSILFKILKIISSDNPKLNTLIDDRTLYSLSTQLDQNQDFYFDLLAMIISRGSNFPSNYANALTPTFAKNDDNLVSKVSERIHFYIDYSDLLIQSIKYSNELTKSVVRNITENQYQDQRTNTLELIKHFESICIVIELDPQKFISNLDRWGTPTFSKTLIKSIPLYYFEEAAKSDTRLGKETVQYIQNLFDKNTKDDWKEVFANLTGDFYKLTKIVKFHSWNSFALDALKDTLLLRIQNNDTSNEIELTNLIRNFEMSEVDLSNTFKNIRDEFILHRNISIQFFSIFGNWLFKYASLNEKAGDVIRTILIPSLLDDEECLSIIVNDKESIKSIMTNCSPNELSDFKDALRDRFENTRVKDLANFLGVRERKRKDDDK